MLSPIQIVEMLAVEESPLWEVPEALRSCLNGDGVEDQLNLAVATVRSLVAAGVVELIFARWTRRDVERRRLTIEEIEAIYETPRYWRRTSRYEEYVELHLTAG